MTNNVHFRTWSKVGEYQSFCPPDIPHAQALHRHSQTFQDHAHVLVDIINHCRLDEDYHEQLMHYVIVKSFLKMRRWILDKQNSKLFLLALHSVQIESIEEEEHFSPDAMLARPEPRDAPFLDLLSTISEVCDIEIPHLLQVAQQYTHGTSGIPLSLYNPQTCREFHQILRALLDGFQAELEVLYDLMDKLKCAPPLNDLKEHIENVYFYGFTLRQAVYSSILKSYASTIMSFLRKSKSKAPLQSPLPLNCKQYQDTS
jgi:hypothetical protein